MSVHSHGDSLCFGGFYEKWKISLFALNSWMNDAMLLDMTTNNAPMFENSNVLVCHRVIDGVPMMTVFRAGTRDKMDDAAIEVLTMLHSDGELVAPKPLDLKPHYVRYLEIKDNSVVLSPEEREEALWVREAYGATYFQHNAAVENFHHVEEVVAGETPWRKVFNRQPHVSVDDWRSNMKSNLYVENGTGRVEDDALFEKLTPFAVLVNTPVFHQSVFMTGLIDPTPVIN